MCDRSYCLMHCWLGVAEYLDSGFKESVNNVRQLEGKVETVLKTTRKVSDGIDELIKVYAKCRSMLHLLDYFKNHDLRQLSVGFRMKIDS